MFKRFILAAFIAAALLFAGSRSASADAKCDACKKAELDKLKAACEKTSKAPQLECVPGKKLPPEKMVEATSCKAACAPAPANSDGCTAAGQACKCSNTGKQGTCGKGPHKPGLYCQC